MTIESGSAADTVLGGPGSETIAANDDSDTTHAGAGDDTVLLGNGDDTGLQGDGFDTKPGADTLTLTGTTNQLIGFTSSRSRRKPACGVASGRSCALVGY